jgi:hypothetical protein
LNTSLRSPLFTDGDVSGAAWLANTSQLGSGLGNQFPRADFPYKLVLLSFGITAYPATGTSPDKLLHSYVFFGHFDTGANKAPLAELANNSTGYNSFLQNNLYRIYDNGDSQVYY